MLVAVQKHTQIQDRETSWKVPTTIRVGSDADELWQGQEEAEHG